MRSWMETLSAQDLAETRLLYEKLAEKAPI
jgi:hypothetical protein